VNGDGGASGSCFLGRFLPGAATVSAGAGDTRRGRIRQRPHLAVRHVLRADPMPGGCVVQDANGQALAYLYSRDNEDEARQAKVLTKDEARRIVINIARLPELLGQTDRQHG
jgi:hypothetical protein